MNPVFGCIHYHIRYATLPDNTIVYIRIVWDYVYVQDFIWHPTPPYIVVKPPDGELDKKSQDHKKSLALGLVPPKNEGGGFEYTDHANLQIRLLHHSFQILWNLSIQTIKT